jgi:hypothetical protein
MRRIVFYSWQSDLPNGCNRTFIQKALEEAVAAIAADDTVAVEPVLDRDTQNVPGSPDIASTIFAKISAAHVFVADVTITTKAEGQRPTPNPNVLIELGYAVKTLGYERVIPVFNTAFGDFPDLPFDLRGRRLLPYNMPADVTDRAAERKKLKDQLEDALRVALEAIPEDPAPSIPSVEAIENARPNKIVVLRRDLDRILKELESLQPRKHSSSGTADELIDTIGKTQEAVARFSRIAETIAVIGDLDCALDTYRWFGNLFEHYELSKDFRNGLVSEGDYDYFRFVGHELFVTLVAFMIREQRWDILMRLLDEPIPVPYLRHSNGPANVTWEYASKHLPLLGDESRKKARLSLRADILKARHTTGGLAAVLPFDDFMAADLFMFLRGELPPTSPGPHFEWNPWTCIYLQTVPLFLQRTSSRAIAVQVGKALGVLGADEFKKRLQERIGNLGRRYSELAVDLRPQDFDFVATQGLAQIIT